MEFNFFNIDKTAYKVSDFLSWQKIGSLVLSPSFQRRPVWSKSAKSYLLDTVARGLPIPIIILRERLDLNTLEPKREVVDGQQRLRTLLSYIQPDSLSDYSAENDNITISKTHNKLLSGKTFRQLNIEIQQRLLNYSFSVHVLPSETDDREVLQIFARLNSTGTKLNGQELRNAKFYGEFKKLAYELAYSNLNRWRSWNIFSETDIARMIEVEETSDAMLLILEGQHGKTQATLDKLYKKYEDEFDAGDEVARRFGSVMEKIEEVVGVELSNTVFSRKALFHTLFCFFYDLMFKLKSPLMSAPAKKLPRALRDSVLEASDRIRHAAIPEELAKKLRGATSDLGSRRERLAFLESVLKDVTNK